MDSIKNKISYLQAKLKQWEHEYYALESPSIDDSSYDAYLKELIELEKQYPQYSANDSPTKRVGGVISEKFNKVKHSVPMLSLSNAFDNDDLMKFDQDIKKELNISNNIEYVVEPKIDGLSIAIIYKNGKLIQAITRGDGIIGEDVTNNIKTIKSIPLNIDFLEEIEIRGEVYLGKKEFINLNAKLDDNKKFQNARNAASGSLRNLDSSITASRNLSAIFYYIHNNKKINVFTQYEILQWIKKHNIPIANETIKVDSIEKVLLKVNEISSQRDMFSFDIDGIVIKVNDINYYEEIGYTSKFPKWAIAYKFPANIQESKINDINVTIGRTGRVNFIASIDSVFIDGSNITKATLHNVDYIHDKDIRIGDYVKLYKAGDIIPKIIEPIISKRKINLKKYEPPINCPYCGNKLKRFLLEVDLYCDNLNCNEVIIQKIIHFASRNAMNIDGLSEKIIRKLYDNKFIKNITDLYLLHTNFEEIKQKNLLLKDKSLKNLFVSIENSKTNSLEKLIFALGIRHVGFNVSKLLARRFKNIDNLAISNFDQLISVGDVGVKICSSINDWFNNEDNKQLINLLKKYNVNINYIDEYSNIKIQDKNLIYFHKSFVITGSFSESRNIIKNILESVYDSKITSTVTKNTDFLIVGENPTKNKIEKANFLNIKLINNKFW